MRRLILRQYQSPGDIVMLTAAVRDLHRTCPGQFATDVRTSAAMLWENNPYVTPLDETAADVATIDMHYPLIHESNQAPYHFIHGFARYLETVLDARIPITEFKGDIHLSDDEKRWKSQVEELGYHGDFWIIVAGGKYDFTAKWWDPSRYQRVVDHFDGRIQFVQCGASADWHPRLENVIDLVGKTSIRQFVRLMYHARGVLCPVTFAMHLASAVETRPDAPRDRPCVVIAGGREPAQWEAYPHHQFLSTNGTLPCCECGGCWRARCQRVGDRHPKDYLDLCVNPVQVERDLSIPQCLDMIAADDVIRRIELYCRGDTLRQGRARMARKPASQQGTDENASDADGRDASERKEHVLLGFLHGLGDVVQFTIVLQHLRHARPDWDVDVVCRAGTHSALTGLCRSVRPVTVAQDGSLDFRGGLEPARQDYDWSFELDWPESPIAYRDWPSTKVTYTLKEVFRIEPNAELFQYRITIGKQARRLTAEYLNDICGTNEPVDGLFPSVVIHYQGATSVERKDLTHTLVRKLCNHVLERGLVPVILDWNGRSPIPDQKTVYCPQATHDLWAPDGIGDAERIAALIQQSTLMVGIDSGPLHVAAATTTPTIGVWRDHHPVRFIDPADNVLHLVPKDHFSRTQGPAATQYFCESYKFREYGDLERELLAVAGTVLNGAELDRLDRSKRLSHRSTSAYDRSYYRDRKASGCDYAAYGDWQRSYGRWLVDCLDLCEKDVLDVGCACGMMARGLSEAGAKVVGVDCSGELIRIGRERIPQLAHVLFIADAANLHYWQDDSFDCIHLHHVAEHWKPQLVPLILQELRRVAVSDGLLFGIIDTVRENGREKMVEPRCEGLRCLRPESWWHEQLAAAGWMPCSCCYERRLRSHELSFLNRYNWSWLIAMASS